MHLGRLSWGTSDEQLWRLFSSTAVMSWLLACQATPLHDHNVMWLTYISGMLPWIILTYYTSPIICHSLYALKSVRDVIQSSWGKNTCDITISFCRITVIAKHVGDKNSVIFPQLSASYQTSTTKHLSHLLLAFYDIKIFSSAPHPEIFRFPCME